MSLIKNFLVKSTESIRKANIISEQILNINNHYNTFPNIFSENIKEFQHQAAYLKLKKINRKHKDIKSNFS